MELFIEQGAKVMIAGRSSDKGAQMVESLGENAAYVRTDVSHEDDVAAAIRATVERFGRMDILFSNAGAPSRGAIDTITQDDFTSAMNVLVGSILFGIKHAAPIMKEQGRGSIINTTSVAGLRGNMGGYLYSIAKAAVAHTTRLASLELGRYGITVNSIAPGAVATPIFYGGSAAAAQMDPDQSEAKLAKLKANLAKATPLRRSGVPRDIAHAALYLASDEAAFVNGHDLIVDGGMTAGGRVNYE